ncbi:uncharacterized protein EV154DRAFT_560448 [Mucor mucedo]|uniref:uncharacterized protein n=1 Tax=Mucor mucedo TaxID=29922 RepID=UPI00221EB679|nr:uncharacterized protein EV154DRAFT_560448 [Mucor mucedo]KAI7894495.1 hypothetical protein EV154DRAFT_560448 [Mucor mucedo]
MVDNVETARVSTSANTSQTSMTRTLKASCNFSPGDEGHVYDEASIQEHAFTTSKLRSIELYDIVTSFQVFSGCHRQIVRLMNTVIRDHEKLAEEYNPHIFYAGPVSTLLKERTIKAHEYDNCKNVCQLFDITQDEKVCSVCKESRYESEVPGSVLIPVQTIKMMSVGDQLSKLLSHEETRQKLRYRHDRKENPGNISDYFDGEDYKALKAADLFQSPEDIALVLFVDGVVNQSKSKQEMTIVHYMVQLVTIPGKPKDLDSFFLSIVDEIKSLGKHGLIVERWNGESVKAKVHLIMATGDIPHNHYVVHSTFHKSYMEYWSTRSNTASSTYLREQSTSVVREVQDSVLGNIGKTIQTNLVSVEDSSTMSNIITNESNMVNNLKEGHLQYRLLTGSSLINLDDVRLTGLVSREVIEQIKNDMDLPTFQVSEAAAILLSKIKESVTSSRELRTPAIAISFVLALNTTIAEFSGGINFNNVDKKENQDLVKLSSACKKSIDYITASTDLTLPIPEYVVRFYDGQFYLESAVKLHEDVYTHRAYSLQ